MRIPSEALAVKWSDIDWTNGRMTIRASKTEHHKHGGVRVMPIFPETLALLEEAFLAPEGAEFVINRTRDPGINLRTGLLRILGKAGVEPWQKLWQNLRASRAKELAALFPSHVAAGWLGHTEAVANKHYRQITDEDFAKAAKLTSVPRGTKCGTPDFERDCRRFSRLPGDDTTPWQPSACVKR